MSIVRFRLLPLAFVLGYALGAAAAEDKAFVPVTDQMLQNPSDGDWLMWRRTLDGWGYSPLEQINRSNVAQLKHGLDARPMGTGRPGRHAARARRRDVHPEPRRLHPGDRRARPATLLWEYRRKLPEGVNGGTNRTIAIWGTTLIDASADNMIYALDARTGKLVWETQVLDPTKRARAERRADHRQRQGDHGPPVPARRRPATRASSRRTTRRPARSSGARARSRARASRATKPGATCRWSSAGTSAPGWCRATTPS